MKWVSLSLLTIALSLGLIDNAPAQTPPSSQQIRDRVNQNVLFLMGGQPGATFNQLANDIAVVMGSTGDLRVLSVDGGAAVENVEDVVYLRSIDMALTTQEAMNFLKTSGQLGPHLEQRITYIAPLFPNPLQILARGDARSIKDLSGKTVNFNNKGSATAQFVPGVFTALGVNAQAVYMSQGDALEKLRTGEIDATICSCPAPVPAYASVKAESGLHFLTVPYDSALKASYLPGSIGNEDYPALIAKNKEVDTISASTVLISFNWQKGTDRYERMAKFVDAFFSKIGEFHKPPRSPLWKSVNVAATLPGWTRFPAAEEWLANWRAGRLKEDQADFTRFMSQVAPQGSPAQTEELFRQYQDWRNK